MKVKSKTTKVIWILAILMSVGLVKAQSVANPFPFGSDAAKQQWILANPGSYQTMGGQVTPVNPTARPVQMTEQEKLAWYAAHPDQQGSRSNTVSQQGIATQMPWGNGDKAAWIAAHPRQYAEMNTDNRIRVSRADFNALPAGKQQAMRNDPNYVIEDPTSSR